MDPQHEKQASVALTLAGAGAGHVLTNMLLRHKINDPRFLADIFRAGYHHGLEGKQVSSFRSGLFRRIAGPEIPEMYHYARYSGAVDRLRKAAPDVFNQLVQLPPDQHQAYLSRLGRRVQRRPEIKDLIKTLGASSASSYGHDAGRFADALKRMQQPTPEQVRPLRLALKRAQNDMPVAAKAVFTAVKRERLNRPMGLTARFFAGERPQFMQRLGMAPRAVTAARSEPTGRLALAKRYLPEIGGLALGAIPGALPAVASHIVPEIAGHLGINAVRDLVARTNIGRKMFGQTLERAMAGKAMPPALLTDLVLSPGVTEFIRGARTVGDIRRAAAPLLPRVQPPAVAAPVQTAPMQAAPVRPAPIRTGWVGGRYVPHSAYLRSRIRALPTA